MNSLVSLKFGSIQVLLYDFMCDAIYMRNVGWFWLGIALSYVEHIGYVYIFSLGILYDIFGFGGMDIYDMPILINFVSSHYY